MYGTDVSKYGFDYLDRKSFEFLDDNCESSVNCMDIGCGLAYVSLVYSLMGHKPHMIDLREPPSIPVLKQYNLLKNYHSGNAVDIISSDFLHKDFKLIYSQKFIHFLKYVEAKKIINYLYSILENDGRLFISSSSLHSELSNGYNKNPDLEKRYSKISKENQEKHNIKARVCLYQIDEFRELLESEGFKVREIYLSDFGTIKSICDK
jgi:2-polyprenyl-3-methyl-5-hydroxy-6-metoxy-1,4-benzoquinol methylase